MLIPSLKDRFFIAIDRVRSTLSYTDQADFNANAKIISQALDEIIIHYNNNDPLTSESILCRLNFLLNHLDIIKNYDNKLFKKFRSDLRKFHDNDNFYSTRFEIATCAGLIRNQVNFLKQESPDFKIKSFNSFIECGSCRMRGGNVNEDFSYKILSTVRKKGKKQYCTTHTALFLDVTNVIFNSSAKTNGNNDIQQIKQMLGVELQNIQYGAVLLFTNLFIKEELNYISTYSRVDNISISFGLKLFLDTYYPIGTSISYKVSIPYENI